MLESLDQAPPSLRRFATAQICLSVTPESRHFGEPLRSLRHAFVVAALEDYPCRSSLSRPGRAAAPMPRPGRTGRNLVRVAVEPEDGLRRPAPVRHLRGGKRRGHDGFQIAPSGGRSLGVEAL
jgi:hypothetical protein